MKTKLPMRQITVGFGLLFLLIGVFVITHQATVVDDEGLDSTDFIVIGTSALALVLCILSTISYKRDGRSQLLYLVLAFGLFALKGTIIIGGDIFGLPQPLFDNIANLLDFAFLLCFFVSIIKSE